MARPSALTLHFAGKLVQPKTGKSLCDGLSAALQIGPTLWLANDESATVERLTLDGTNAAAHRQFALDDYLDLPVPRSRDATPEIDIEGLDYAHGWLWITGSHGRKRCKPEDDDPLKAQKQLGRIEADANRYVLARIPVVPDKDGLPSLARKTGKGADKRVAGMLEAGADGNALTRALARDRHLAPFLRLPGKENGFDIEGLAVAGDRLFLGLRGPVLAGWATVLELRIRAGRGGALSLAPFGDKHKSLVHKHFLELGGLGVRDLCLHGDDLLLLAGPTMALDGPVRVVRWKDAGRCDGPCVVRADALETVLDIPSGDGCDHAEGMTFLHQGEAETPRLLVVYDISAPERRPTPQQVQADVFTLAAG